MEISVFEKQSANEKMVKIETVFFPWKKPIALAIFILIRRKPKNGIGRFIYLRGE